MEKKRDKHYCAIHGFDSTCDCNAGKGEPSILRNDRERLIFIYGIIVGFIGASVFWACFFDALNKLH